MIHVEQLRVAYAGRPALQGVDVQLDAGQIVGLVGPSGAGKSTLLRALNGFVKPTGGRTVVCGRDPATLHGAALRAHRAEVGMIYQSFHLVTRKTAAENAVAGATGRISTWRTLLGIVPTAEQHNADRALARVGLAPRAGQRADTLSGGQRQRVAIARTLVQNPRVVLADEPVASLDPGSSTRVLSLLRSLAHDDGRTVLVSLHQIEYAREFCDRIVALEEGRVVIDSTPDLIESSAWQRLYDSARADAESHDELADLAASAS